MFDLVFLCHFFTKIGSFSRVVISAGRNYNSRPGGKNWQKLAETGLNRQKLAEIQNKLMGCIERGTGSGRNQTTLIICGGFL